MSQTTLLLIANHQQLAYLIQRYAEQSGCRVVCVGAVEPALERMQRDQPAMVLLHLMSWPQDGWAILRQLRAQRATERIPITVISALADETRARAEGANYWLWQPVMYVDFLAALFATGALLPTEPPGPCSPEGEPRR